MLKHYVYRHIRLDTNQPFYIGIGTKRTRNTNDSFLSHTSEYERAFSTSNRNIHWKRVVAKTQYRVEIIFESDCYTEVKDKEIEFISLYGRHTDGGILTNQTIGGDGTVGVSRTDAEKAHLSNINKGKRLSEETKQKLRETVTGRRMSEDAITKMREVVRRPMTQEEKDHLSNKNKGKKHTEETKIKLRSKDLSYLHTKENIEKSSQSRKGKYRGDNCWNSRLTSREVREIKQAYLPHYSDRDIADRFGVSARTINKIRKQETWKDI